MIAAVARFIAQRPDNNAGVVKIPSDHATHALYIRVRPGIIIGYQTHGHQPVCLDICLINDVHSEAVTEIIETWLMRIMRAPYGIEIVLFHQTNVGLNLRE